MVEKVFVTRRIPQAGLDALAAGAEVVVSPHDRDLSPEEVIAQSAGCRALVPTLANRVDGPLFDARPEIRIVANFAVGVDNIDLEAARQRGVVVTNTPGVLTAATADLAMALILAVTRRLVEGDAILRAGQFKGITPLFMLGSDLEGKTLGVFGLGRIGLALARRAAAFGLRIIYHKRSRRPEAEAELGAAYVGFDQLLAESDILSINAPLTEETKGLFNYQAFARMKREAFLINTGRGPIVVEADLVRALDEGLIQGAGLDVYEREPEVHPGLLDKKNVVLAPHLGSATQEVRTKMALLVAENVIAFLGGREPPNRVV